jgi:hypothetical protein
MWSKVRTLFVVLLVSCFVVDPVSVSLLAKPKKADPMAAYVQSEVKRNAKLARHPDRATAGSGIRKLAMLTEVGLVHAGPERLQALDKAIGTLDEGEAIEMGRKRHAAYANEMRTEYGVEIGSFDEAKLLEGIALVKRHGFAKVLLVAKSRLERQAKAVEEGYSVVRIQKPGDDFGGYPEFSGGGDFCGGMELAVAVMALISCFMPELSWMAGMAGVVYALMC